MHTFRIALLPLRDMRNPIGLRNLTSGIWHDTPPPPSGGICCNVVHFSEFPGFTQSRAVCEKVGGRTGRPVPEAPSQEAS